MNTEENTTSPDARPLGFWLRVVDGLLTREFAARFDADGIDRREWMLLNAVSGDIDAPWITARLARGGKRVRALADRGWITRIDGTWSLTDEGRAAKDRLCADADAIRARVSGAVSPEDYATMTASLEAIARELGWDEARGREVFGPHGRGRGHRFGRHTFRPDFGPARGFRPDSGPAQGFGPDRDLGSDFRPAGGFGPGHEGAPCHPHHRGHGAGHRHGANRRGDERAYARGFDAGFTRGREAAASGSAA